MHKSPHHPPPPEAETSRAAADSPLHGMPTLLRNQAGILLLATETWVVGAVGGHHICPVYIAITGRACCCIFGIEQMRLCVCIHTYTNRERAIEVFERCMGQRVNIPTSSTRTGNYDGVKQVYWDPNTHHCHKSMCLWKNPGMDHQPQLLLQRQLGVVVAVTLNSSQPDRRTYFGSSLTPLEEKNESSLKYPWPSKAMGHDFHSTQWQSPASLHQAGGSPPNDVIATVMTEPVQNNYGRIGCFKSSLYYEHLIHYIILKYQMSYVRSRLSSIVILRSLTIVLT